MVAVVMVMGTTTMTAIVIMILLLVVTRMSVTVVAAAGMKSHGSDATTASCGNDDVAMVGWRWRENAGDSGDGAAGGPQLTIASRVVTHCHTFAHFWHVFMLFARCDAPVRDGTNSKALRHSGTRRHASYFSRGVTCGHP